MPDTTHYGDVTTGFAELVYADPAWLDAEFNAIVAANFDRRVPLPPARRRPIDPAGSSRHRPPYALASHRWPSVPIPAPAPPRRERAPPLRLALSQVPDPKGR
jgi:hypothetical protein